MNIFFKLKDKYCWISKDIVLVLISYKDSRCYQSPDMGHLCFWEGDFACVFDVVKIHQNGKKSSEILKRITLNDHDYRNKRSVAVDVPDLKKPYKLILSGGPRHAFGYKVTNDLTFEFTYHMTK